MSAREREIGGIAAKCELEILELGNTGSGHIYAVVRAQDGRQKRFFFSRTPSDGRGDLNKASLLRRFSRAH